MNQRTNEQATTTEPVNNICISNDYETVAKAQKQLKTYDDHATTNKETFLLQKCKESRQIKIDNGLAQLDSRPIVVMKYLGFYWFYWFLLVFLGWQMGFFRVYTLKQQQQTPPKNSSTDRFCCNTIT